MSFDSCKVRWSIWGTPLTERCKIAHSRLNLKFKSIATEDFSNRNDQLFSPGFLERASKKVETEKALDNVSESGPPYKRPRTVMISAVFHPKVLLQSVVAGMFSTFLNRTISRKPSPRTFSSTLTPRHLINEPHFFGVICGRGSESPGDNQLPLGAGGCEGVPS